MGHRFEALNLPAHLVAWHEAGLELVRKDMLGAIPAVDTFTQDGGVCACLAQETTARDESRRIMHGLPGQAAQSIVPQAGDASQDRQASASAEPQATAGASATHSPALSDISSASGRSGRERFTQKSAQGHQLPDGRESKKWLAPLSGEQQSAPASEPCVWTGPFQFALERLKPPVHAVWTYWELALDFGGEPNSARRQLWANIIKNLPYKQRVGFWPVSEFQNGVMLAKPALFWQGVREFSATHVLCFGRRACMTLFPDRPFSPGVFQFGGLTAVILPGPEDMLPDNRQLKAVTWNLLKDLRV